MSTLLFTKIKIRIKFLIRKKTTGSFGKDFQISFVVENVVDIENAVLLLTEISNSWSRDELISAFNLYCKIPLDEISSKNKKIIKFADLLSKPTKEVAKRFKNFSKLDATVNLIEGLDKEDKNTWDSFNENWSMLAYESENRIIDFENKLRNITVFPKGKERDSIVKARINQTFFECDRLRVPGAESGRAATTSGVQRLFATTLKRPDIRSRDLLICVIGICRT